MARLATIWLATVALAACAPEAAEQPRADEMASNGSAPAGAAQLSLNRLDCGNATVKNFDTFLSDRPGLYEAKPREITDSCYLIRNGDRAMVWDTGFSAGLKGKSQDMGDLVARLDATLPEQLAELGLQPSDIDIVGISHAHPDHTGQATQFPRATLLIGRGDFEQTAGKDDPFAPWRGEGK